MKTFVNSTVLWLCLIIGLLGSLVLVNQVKPEKIEIKETTPKKSLVACFINNRPIFNGEVIGGIKLGPDGRISFFSSEMNAEVQLLNASCIVLETS